jgi:hypothetical protein
MLAIGYQGACTAPHDRSETGQRCSDPIMRSVVDATSRCN